MTVKEAITFLKHPSQWESLNVGKQIAIDTLIDAQPCEDIWIIDALKEFLGENYSVITSNKTEFILWLKRLRWHVGKCNELYTELREYKKQVGCEDAISRADALKALDYDIKSFEFKSGVSKHMNEIANLLNTIYEIQSDNIKALPPVQPKIKTGKWIYRNYNWYCSECNNTPKTLGYVGKAEFMKEHFKFCNHCGAMMLDNVMTEDEKEADDERGN